MVFQVGLAIAFNTVSSDHGSGDGKFGHTALGNADLGNVRHSFREIAGDKERKTAFQAIFTQENVWDGTAWVG